MQFYDFFKTFLFFGFRESTPPLTISLMNNLHFNLKLIPLAIKILGFSCSLQIFPFLFLLLKFS